MYEIVSKFLWAADKFMPEIHLRHPGFTYSAWGAFIKKRKKENWKFKETVDSRYTYQNKLNKYFYQSDVANGDFEELTRRTDFDKILRDKALNIANNPKYDGCQRGLAWMVYKF